MDRYSTFWPRFFALTIDGIVLAFLSRILELIPRTDLKAISIILTIIASNITYAYSVLMIGKYGQTLGKMAMNIKVVDNETESKVTYDQAFKREAIPIFLVNLSIISTSIVFTDINLQFYELSILENIIIFLPSFMSLIWSILEIVTMLFDAKNRALHDKIADTVVVRT